MRKYLAKMRGERYLGNLNTKEVHDLDNEKSMCQTNKIIMAGNEKPFPILSAAREAGFNECLYCMEHLKKKSN